MTQPLFTEEGPAYYGAAYQHNAPFATPGPYQTPLTPDEESKFRRWVLMNQVPFDPRANVADYDMRGYWKDTGGAKHVPGQHFPDTYKTPYDTSFSRESKYATPNCPFTWQGDRLVDTRNGQVVFGPPTGLQMQSNFKVVHSDGSSTAYTLTKIGANQYESAQTVELRPGDVIHMDGYR